MVRGFGVDGVIIMCIICDTEFKAGVIMENNILQTGPITPEIIESFKAELQALLARYNVEIGVDVQGDTWGLQYDFVISRVWSDDLHVLVKHYNHVGVSELRKP